MIAMGRYCPETEQDDIWTEKFSKKICKKLQKNLVGEKK